MSTEVVREGAGKAAKAEDMPTGGTAENICAFIFDRVGVEVGDVVL